MVDLPTDGKRRAEAEEVRVGWRMAAIGMQVASEVAAGVILGWLFDLWRGHGTIGVTVGAAVGILVALWSLLRNTLKLNKLLERTAPTAGRGKPLPADDELNDENNNDRDDWNKPNE